MPYSWNLERWLARVDDANAGPRPKKSEIVGHQRLLEEHERKVAALRQAQIDGENSGEADELDMKKIKATAQQWSSR